ncbi:MAG TPA: MarR family transcriptional regulator [Gaiellaceae bacterium]
MYADAPTDALPLERVIRVAEFRAGLRAFMHRSEEIAQSWGLTPQRYLLLLTIKGAADGSERLSFTQISRRLYLSRNTVTELCQRAEEAGLIRRERSDSDQRVVYLRLTDEGDRRLTGVLLESDRLRRELDKTFRRLSASLSATAAR